MAVELRVRAGVDSALVVWRSPPVHGCRGFALKRKIKRAPGSAPSPHTEGSPDAQGFIEEAVSSWVGFATGIDVEPGTRRPTTEWPIQKYLWSDFLVNVGDRVAYRVTPMVGPAGNLTPADDQASSWSEVVLIGAETDGRVACFFVNGGPIPGQRGGVKAGQCRQDLLLCKGAPIGAPLHGAGLSRGQSGVISPVSGSMISSAAWFCSAPALAGGLRPTDCLSR